MALLDGSTPAPETPNVPTSGGTEPKPGPTYPEWRQGLPETIRGEKVFDNVKDLGDLGTQFVHAQKLVGGSVRVPKDDAKPEEWTAFYRTLGVPEKPEEYAIDRSGVPEGAWDETLEKSFRKEAHGLGLTPKQVAGVVKWHTGTIGQLHKDAAEAAEKTEQLLKNEWGANFSKNVGLANRALGMVGGPEMVALLGATGLSNHPVMAKFFYRIGAEMSEAGLIPGEIQGVMSAEDAKKKIAAIRNDKEHPFHKGNTPGGAEARAEMEQLYQIAYPEKPRSTV